MVLVTKEMPYSSAPRAVPYQKADEVQKVGARDGGDGGVGDWMIGGLGAVPGFLFLSFFFFCCGFYDTGISPHDPDVYYKWWKGNIFVASLCLESILDMCWGLRAFDSCFRVLQSSASVFPYSS